MGTASTVLIVNENLTVDMLTLDGLGVGLSRPCEKRTSATATSTNKSDNLPGTSVASPTSTLILTEPIDANDPIMQIPSPPPLHPIDNRENQVNIVSDSVTDTLTVKDQLRGIQEKVPEVASNEIPTSTG